MKTQLIYLSLSIPASGVPVPENSQNALISIHTPSGSLLVNGVMEKHSDSTYSVHGNFEDLSSKADLPKQTSTYEVKFKPGKEWDITDEEISNLVDEAKAAKLDYEKSLKASLKEQLRDEWTKETEKVLAEKESELEEARNKLADAKDETERKRLRAELEDKKRAAELERQRLEIEKANAEAVALAKEQAESRRVAEVNDQAQRRKHLQALKEREADIERKEHEVGKKLLEQERLRAEFEERKKDNLEARKEQQGKVHAEREAFEQAKARFEARVRASDARLESEKADLKAQSEAFAKTKATYALERKSFESELLTFKKKQSKWNEERRKLQEVAAEAQAAEAAAEHKAMEQLEAGADAKMVEEELEKATMAAIKQKMIKEKEVLGDHQVNIEHPPVIVQVAGDEKPANMGGKERPQASKPSRPTGTVVSHKPSRPNVTDKKTEKEQSYSEEIDNAIRDKLDGLVKFNEASDKNDAEVLGIESAFEDKMEGIVEFDESTDKTFNVAELTSAADEKPNGNLPKLPVEPQGPKRPHPGKTPVIFEGSASKQGNENEKEKVSGQEKAEKEGKSKAQEAENVMEEEEEVDAETAGNKAQDKSEGMVNSVAADEKPNGYLPKLPVEPQGPERPRPSNVPKLPVEFQGPKRPHPGKTPANFEGSASKDDIKSEKATVSDQEKVEKKGKAEGQEPENVVEEEEEIDTEIAGNKAQDKSAGMVKSVAADEKPNGYLAKLPVEPQGPERPRPSNVPKLPVEFQGPKRPYPGKNPVNLEGSASKGENESEKGEWSDKNEAKAEKEAPESVVEEEVHPETVDNKVEDRLEGLVDSLVADEKPNGYLPKLPVEPQGPERPRPSNVPKLPVEFQGPKRPHPGKSPIYLEGSASKDENESKKEKVSEENEAKSEVQEPENLVEEEVDPGNVDNKVEDKFEGIVNPTESGDKTPEGDGALPDLQEKHYAQAPEADDITGKGLDRDDDVLEDTSSETEDAAAAGENGGKLSFEERAQSLLNEADKHQAEVEEKALAAANSETVADTVREQAASQAIAKEREDADKKRKEEERAKAAGAMAKGESNGLTPDEVKQMMSQSKLVAAEGAKEEQGEQMEKEVKEKVKDKQKEHSLANKSGQKPSKQDKTKGKATKKKTKAKK